MTFSEIKPNWCCLKQPLPPNQPAVLDLLGSLALEKHEFELVGKGAGASVLYKQCARTNEISQAHSLAKRMAADDDPLFVLKHLDDDISIVESTELGAQFKRLMNVDMDALKSSNPMYRMSPIFRIMTTLCNRFEPGWVDVHYPRASAEAYERLANGLVAVIRRWLRKEFVVRAYSNFRRSATENFNNMNRRFANLPRRIVCILRGDVHYDVSPPDEEPRSLKSDKDGLKTFQRLHAKFQRWFNKEFGNAVLDHFWCLEHGVGRGWHSHFAILLDPDKYDTTDDVGLVTMLGERWKFIAAGRGGYFNVNEVKDQFEFCAVGLVDTSNGRVAKGWQFIAAYFTLAGLFVQLDIPKRVRTFGTKRIRIAKRRRIARAKRRMQPSISVADILRRGLRFI